MNINKLLSIVLFFPLIGIGQNWQQLSNFPADGRHHPITFANNEYGFVISGSYLTDAYK